MLQGLRSFASEALKPKFSSKYLIQHVSSKLIPAVKVSTTAFAAHRGLDQCRGGAMACACSKHLQQHVPGTLLTTPAGV